MDDKKVKPENLIPNLSDNALTEIGDTLTDWYNFRSYRSGGLRQLGGLSLEDWLKESREMFWNSYTTDSEDLRELDLDFSLPFIRKEGMDFMSRIISMNIAPKLTGEDLGVYGVKVLQAMQKKWRLKSKDRVEKFWQTLYSMMNGTVCIYLGYDGKKTKRRYLKAYDPATGTYDIDEKEIALWDDAFTEIVPLEDMYLSKIWERNIQKQGKTIRKQEMTVDDFKMEFPKEVFPDAEFVVPGDRIAEDSLFFQLLSGSGITSTNKIQLLKEFDTYTDKYKIIANGVWVNRLGTDKAAPIPFNHKNQPYIWSQNEPIDEKFAYGLSLPQKLKGSSKLLNTSFTMQAERELRAIDPPVLSSDFEAPQLIYGQHRVIPVNDVEAYKEMPMSEASNSFLSMQGTLQGLMTSFAQGGVANMSPSRQPVSAREILSLDQMKQQALSNSLVMYFDLVYQELMLLLKTQMQFYQAGKYDDNKILRSFTVPNFPLSQGGIGNLEIRIVKDPKDGLELYFEAVHKSVSEGKTTEIIEVPVELLNDLTFFIEDIILEPAQSDDLKIQTWTANVFNPMMEYFVPAGLADPSKLMRRMLEKNSEHPLDYASDNALGSYLLGKGAPTPNIGPAEDGASPFQTTVNEHNGKMRQMTTGVRYGGQSNGGMGKNPQ
jgi:hypothetical protein